MEFVVVGLVIVALALGAVLTEVLRNGDQRTVRDVMQSWRKPKPVPVVAKDEKTLVPVPQKVRDADVYGENDQLYKIIRSGMPNKWAEDEHAITLEIRRRVLVMYIQPLLRSLDAGVHSGPGTAVPRGGDGPLHGGGPVRNAAHRDG